MGGWTRKGQLGGVGDLSTEVVGCGADLTSGN